MEKTETGPGYSIRVTGKESFTAHGIVSWPNPGATGLPFEQSFQLAQGRIYPNEEEALKAAFVIGREIAKRK